MNRIMWLASVSAILVHAALGYTVRDSEFALNAAPSASGCAAPPPTDFFETSDASLVYWVNIADMKAGDTVVFQWKTSAGKFDSSHNYQSVQSAGSYCYWYTAPLSSNPVSAVDGNWTFDVFVNNTLAVQGVTQVVGPNDTSISRGGVVNLASGVSRAGMISAGSLLAIFGNNLAPNTAFAPSTPLPTSLNGVSVTLNGKPVGMVAVSSGEIDVQAPWSIPSDTAFIQVNNNGIISNTERVLVASTAPGLFYDSSTSANTATVYRFGQDGSRGWVSASNPLLRGDTAVFLATGLGPVADPPPNFSPGNGDSNGLLPVTVAFGGARSSNTSTSLSTATDVPDAGVAYVWATVPNETPNGAAVPITIQVAGAVANAVTVPVGGAAPAVAAPTLTSIDGYPHVSGATSYNPGSAISLSANAVYPNVRTYVKFSDNTGYSVTMPAFSVYSDRVISMVPPYVNQASHTTTAGTVSCSILQVVTGQILTSNAQTISISPLYAANSPTGKMTSQYLATAAQGAREIDSGYVYKQQISAGKSFTAVSANAVANSMTTGLQPLVGGAEEVASGDASSIDLGPWNGQELTIDSPTLSLTDALIAAVLSESAKAYVNPPVVTGNLRSASTAPRPESTIVGNLLTYFGKVAQCNMPWNQISDEDTGTSSNCPSPTQALTTVVNAAASSLREAVDSTAEDAKRFAQGVGLGIGALAGGEGVAIVAELASNASVAQAVAHTALYFLDNGDEASADKKAALDATREYLADKLSDAAVDQTGVEIGSLDSELGQEWDDIKDSPAAKIVEQIIENEKEATNTLVGPSDEDNGNGTNSVNPDLDNEPAVELTGMATDSTGAGLQNVGVELTDGSDSDTPIATGATDTDGDFDLLVPKNDVPPSALFQITALDESGDVVMFDGNNVNLQNGSQSIGTFSISYDPDDDGDDDSDGSEIRIAPTGFGSAGVRRASVHKMVGYGADRLRALSAARTIAANQPSSRSQRLPNERVFSNPEMRAKSVIDSNTR